MSNILSRPKNILTFLSFMMTLCLCNKRDLSSPTTRLVGHWIGVTKITQEESEKRKKLDDAFKNELGKEWKQELSLYREPGVYKSHWYFGRTDSQKQEGTFKFISSKGETFEGFYKIIKEEPEINCIRIAIFSNILKRDSVEKMIYSSSNGKYLIILDIGRGDSLYYADSKTQ